MASIITQWYIDNDIPEQVPLHVKYPRDPRYYTWDTDNGEWQPTLLQKRIFEILDEENNKQWHIEQLKRDAVAFRQKGKLVFVTFTLEEEHSKLSENDIKKRVYSVLTAKENKPLGSYGAMEKTEAGVWHVHLLLHYSQSGHNGLGASFFKRYWPYGYIKVVPGTMTTRSVNDLLKYISKEPYYKFGDATYFQENLNLLL